MAGSPKRRARTDRWTALMADPATLRDICAHVAEGGGVPGWCRQHDVRFADVWTWLVGDERRRALFEAARGARVEHGIEHVNAVIYDLTMVDLADAYDAHGRLRRVQDMPEKLRRALSALELDADGSPVKIKTVDPARAIELLAKLRRMLIEQHEHTGKLTLEDLVGGSMKPEAPAP